MQLQSVIKAT